MGRPIWFNLDFHLFQYFSSPLVLVHCEFQVFLFNCNIIRFEVTSKFFRFNLCLSRGQNSLGWNSLFQNTWWSSYFLAGLLRLFPLLNVFLTLSFVAIQLYSWSQTRVIMLHPSGILIHWTAAQLPDYKLVLFSALSSEDSNK